VEARVVHGAGKRCTCRRASETIIRWHGRMLLLRSATRWQTKRHTRDGRPPLGAMCTFFYSEVPARTWPVAYCLGANENLGCCLLPIACSCWPWRRKEDGSASSAWRGRRTVGKCTSSCLAVLAAADVATSLATCCAVCVATCVHIKARVRVTTCVQVKALTCQHVIRC
jgi:hypothetical protein